MFVVAEVLGHGQGRVADAKTAAGRFVHLAEHHHHVRQHAGLLHFAVELFAFAATLADTAKYADTLMLSHHVVDHFGEQYGLADAGAAEKSRFASALQRREHIDELDAGFKYFRLRRALRQRRRRAMYGTPFKVVQIRPAVDGIAEDVEHARENRFAHRGFQRAATVLHRHAARQPLCWRQSNAAYMM